MLNMKNNDENSYHRPINTAVSSLAVTKADQVLQAAITIAPRSAIARLLAIVAALGGLAAT